MSNWLELTGRRQAASNWMQQDVLRTLNERNIPIEQFPIRPEGLADLDQAGRKRAISTPAAAAKSLPKCSPAASRPSK